MKVELGATATFEAAFLAPGGGGPAVLDAAPDVAFYDQSDAPVLGDAVPVITPVSSSTWQASVIVPPTIDDGWYKIIWHGLVGGLDVYGMENFQIVNSEDVVPLSTERNLRMRLNDKLADPADDSKAFFFDDEIHGLLALGNSDVLTAALDGWAIKMAYYQDAIDVNESGAERKMSQLFRQAKSMADFYTNQIEERRKLQAASISPPVGLVVNLRNQVGDIFGFGYNPFVLSTSTAYVRVFPLKRFIPIYNTLASSQYGWNSY